MTSGERGRDEGEEYMVDVNMDTAEAHPSSYEHCIARASKVTLIADRIAVVTVPVSHTYSYHRRISNTLPAFVL
jgi:hypothetical protein